MLQTGAVELLQVADAVAREKAIDREEVIAAMEQAIEKAAKAKYGLENDIRAVIDRKNGRITIRRFREVVADVAALEDEDKQVTLSDARQIEREVEVGGFLVQELPPIEFGRITAQAAKQVIVQRVRDAERQRQYQEYKDRVGEIVNGVVKRAEYGNVTIDLGKAEGFMRRDEALPRENFKTGDRIRAYIYDVREEPRGPQIFLSRSRPEFMKLLFAQEVPEVYDGIIRIEACARDPGSRAKIAVSTTDPSIDPVGACVGMRGSRVQAVVGELQGEKIDIIPFSHDTASLVVNALAPAEVSKVVLDEDNGRIEVVVPEDQLSLAIGRRGQNVRLASKMSGWEINILTEDQEAERRASENKTRSELFMNALDVDDVLAQLLVLEGFTSIEDIILSTLEELAEIEGFDADVAEELHSRAEDYIIRRDAELEERRKELGVTDEMVEVSGLTPGMIVKLGEAGVKTRDDLADLAGDELIEILGERALTMDEANAVIMAARAHWFADDDASNDEAEAEEVEEPVLATSDTDSASEAAQNPA